MENKKVKEIEAIVKEVRDILYNNECSEMVKISISRIVGSVSTISYEVTGKVVKFE